MTVVEKFLRDLMPDEILHSGGSLLSHLVNTSRLLSNWGCREDICNAGMLHSVYGTEYFHAGFVSPPRETVRAVVGAEAEYLIYLNSVLCHESLYANVSSMKRFAVLDRSQGLTIPVTFETIAALYTIDLANTLEQLPRVSLSVGEVTEDRIRYLAAKQFLPIQAFADFCAVYRVSCEE
jgi:hypothetical protein